MFSDALKLFAFNLPIVVAFIKKKGEDVLLQTRQHTKALDFGLDFGVYLKSLSFLPTFVTKGCKLSAVAKQKEGGKTAEEVCLINTTVQYLLQTTKFSWKEKETQNINISFTVCKIPLLVGLVNPPLTALEAKRVDEFC
jgi:hypothetical protein